MIQKIQQDHKTTRPQDFIGSSEKESDTVTPGPNLSNFQGADEDMAEWRVAASPGHPLKDRAAKLGHPET